MMREMAQCELKEYCEASASCFHAKEHQIQRCSDCGTCCCDSNGFCLGGKCSQVHGGMEQSLYIAMVKKYGRPRCA